MNETYGSTAEALSQTAWSQCGSSGSSKDCTVFRSCAGDAKNIDIDTNVDRGSGHHSSKHLQEAVLQVTKDLNSVHAFEFIQGHSHSSFPTFSKNLLEKLDFTECYSWISRLLKVWEAVYES